MKLYGLKNCDTSRKALKMLKSAQLIDVRVEGIPSDVLIRAHAQFGSALVNTRSTTWRSLSEIDRAGEPMALLAAYPALMKRPLIERDGELFLGWTKEVQALLLG